MENIIYTPNPHIYLRTLKVKKMVSEKMREPFCGDTMNSLAHESREFQCSVAYKCYFELSREENIMNKVWTSRIAKVECMPEAFDFTELVS